MGRVVRRTANLSGWGCKTGSVIPVPWWMQLVWPCCSACGGQHNCWSSHGRLALASLQLAIHMTTCRVPMAAAPLQVKCTTNQVDDCIARYLWTRQLTQ